jgi:hypothetical protein
VHRCFRTFDDRRLAFLYQDETKDSRLNRFNRFISLDQSD